MPYMELHKENYLIMLMTIQRYTRHALIRYTINNIQRCCHSKLQEFLIDTLYRQPHHIKITSFQ